MTKNVVSRYPPAADMSTAFSAAMLKAYKEGLGVDFVLVCQGEVKHVHSQVRNRKACQTLVVFVTSIHR